ncbi:alpha-N-acetylgalactosaminide alpha-2,6-sialyltransferase 1 [Stegastes partitus]|uniref:alpha-N-acetylgalactosaminide alpha-2,6-sialyltransferase n=1 Tax=Stegastes partitus TaxID=144197 RepID=A0A3B5AGY0_9TELE|nr:PREDICTED: alpha-N-acetylgalactosaminide alpha-2,6-sialyltransferase 1 [Stegastes partitus]
MAVHVSRIFSVLFMASVMVFILSWEHLPKSISWADFSGMYRHRGENISYHSRVSFWEVSSTAGLTTKAETTESTKAAEASKRAKNETPMPVLYKKSFKMLPRWDFEDVYNQDAPPRPTTCEQSLRNSKDESFRKAFLPNIRLFLHKDNINMSEWNRLSHFNNPFGFMEYKYNDVMASVKLIPKPEEPLLLRPKPGGDGCVRCAVVGAAGILNGSKMGAEIDAHDYVFRMNGAVIEGYEDDVGSRTSVYVHTAYSMYASLDYFKKYGYKGAPHDEGIKYVMIPEGLRDFQWLEGLLKGEKIPYEGRFHNIEPRTYYSGQYNESRFYVLHQDFLRYVRNRFLQTPHLNTSAWPIVRPTNGAFALFLALHTCDVVSAYGFMTDDYKKYSNYYFEKAVKTNVHFYVNHDYLMEKDVWKDLHNSKVIRLYQRTEPQTEKEKPKQR